MFSTWPCFHKLFLKEAIRIKEAFFDSNNYLMKRSSGLEKNILLYHLKYLEPSIKAGSRPCVQLAPVN